MEKKTVIGVGEFLWDITPTGKRAGGAPVNFAYHASCDEVEGWAVSAVGKDGLGRELLTVAKEKGIRLLVAEVDRPTGTVDVILNNGQPDFHIHENVAWDYITLTDELQKKDPHHLQSPSEHSLSAVLFRGQQLRLFLRPLRSRHGRSMTSTCVRNSGQRN